MKGLHLGRTLMMMMPVGQMPIGEQQTVDQNTRQIHNVRATARDYREQNTKGYTPSPRIEIKISDPVRNRSRVSGFGRQGPTLWRRNLIFTKLKITVKLFAHSFILYFIEIFCFHLDPNTTHIHNTGIPLSLHLSLSFNYILSSSKLNWVRSNLSFEIPVTIESLQYRC